jgi:hypothetical protein
MRLGLFESRLGENFVGSNAFKPCLTVSLALLVLANPPSGGLESILTVNQKNTRARRIFFLVDHKGYARMTRLRRTSSVQSYEY